MKLSGQANPFINNLKNSAQELALTGNKFFGSLAEFSAYFDPDVIKFNKQGEDYRLLIKERRVAATKLALTDYKSFAAAKEKFQSTIRNEAFSFAENKERADRYKTAKADTEEYRYKLEVAKQNGLRSLDQPEYDLHQAAYKKMQKAEQGALKVFVEQLSSELNVHSLYKILHNLKPGNALLRRMGFELANQDNLQSVSKKVNISPHEVVTKKDAWFNLYAKQFAKLKEQFAKIQFAVINPLARKPFDELYKRTKQEILNLVENYQNGLSPAGLKNKLDSTMLDMSIKDCDQITSLTSRIKDDLNDLIKYTSPLQYCDQSATEIIQDSRKNLVKLRDLLNKLLSYLKLHSKSNATLTQGCIDLSLKLMNMLTANKFKYNPKGSEWCSKRSLSDAMLNAIEDFRIMSQEVNEIIDLVKVKLSSRDMHAGNYRVA